LFTGYTNESFFDALLHAMQAQLPLLSPQNVVYVVTAMSRLKLRRVGVLQKLVAQSETMLARFREAEVGICLVAC
jgi:hypothetical protein